MRVILKKHLFGKSGLAALHAFRAARIEGTDRHLSLLVVVFLGWRHFRTPASGRVGLGDGGNEEFCIRVLRVSEYGVGRTAFHLRALVEDMDIIAYLVSCAEIVRDIEKGNTLFIPKPQHDVQNG